MSSSLAQENSREQEEESTDMDEEMETKQHPQHTQSKEDFEERLKECRDALSQSPNDYHCHLNVVQCLSSIDHMSQFRKARDKMYHKFAIPPSDQMQFIKVEIEYLRHSCHAESRSASNEEINHIMKLYQKAIYDYPVDIQLWSDYLSFVFQHEPVIGIEYIREHIINEAALSIGQHFYEAHKFWSLYREFETGYLAKLVNVQQQNTEKGADGGDTPDMEDIDDMDSDDEQQPDKPSNKIRKQTEQIRKIWRQQIGVLHYQIEDTYRSYQDWECQLYGQPAVDYKEKYNHSKKLSKYFKEWEDKLLELAPNVSSGYASLQRLEFWQDYIAKIRQQIKHIKPKTILSLYERAILDCFLYEQMWVDYIEFVKEQALKFEILNICARSVRNIPLSVRLWTEYIYACEWTQVDVDEINKRVFGRFVFPVRISENKDHVNYLQHKYKMKKDEMVDFGENEIDKYMSLAINKCEYFRRRAHCAIDETYTNDGEQKSNQQRIKDAQQVFTEIALFVDENIHNQWALTFYTFFADFLSRFVGDIGKARDLWEALIKQRGKEWNVWTAVIEWESKFGEMDAVLPSAKKLRHANISSSNDEDVQLMKQRMSGKPFGQRNIYRIRHLYHRAIFILDDDNGLQYIGEQLLQFERMCGDLKSLNAAQIRYHKKLAECRKRREKNEAKRMKMNKRKRSQYEHVQEHVTESPQKTDAGSSKYVDYEQEIKQEPPAKRVKTAHRMPPETAVKHRQKTDPSFVAVEEKGSKEERTVFVYNFRKTMNREDLHSLFSQFGKIEAMKLPIDKNAKHRSKLRGIGYIEYRHKQNAEKCIAELNGKSIQGKVLNVQHYRDKNDYTKTVYVRGLSGFRSQEEAEKCIRTVLKECGEIREIRLTKEQKSGGHKLKGFGYVEFVHKESVHQALKCDKAVYENTIVEVLPYKTERERGSGEQGNQAGNRRVMSPTKQPLQVHAKHVMDVDRENDADVEDVADDTHSHSAEVHTVSAAFGSKLGFIPRAMKRKSKLKEHEESQENAGQRNEQQYDPKILQKTNKTQNDFRKLFNL
mmetsp:Transcript_7584/g.12406  ORF Transcript_7584/g.12406 Transcript_7584/m.12406 type:complete len:1048 (+) Transcript_7584:27-3170(+)